MADTVAGIAPQTDTYANWVIANPTLGKDSGGKSFSQFIFATASPVGTILIWGNDQTFTTAYAAKQYIVSDSKQLCKAWVNFDGTTNTAGKCTIADSYNVTDVDDDGTGLYTINFTNNLTLGYCAVGSGGNTGSITAETIVQIGTLAVDSLIIATSNHAGDPRDRDIICVQIFGS